MGENSPPKSETRRKRSSRRLSLFERKEASQKPTEDRSEGLVFKDICVDVATKRILWSVSGHARPGHVLAILGPSGSGKTTLLNTLAGQKIKTSGSITLSGQALTKRNKRKVSYVLQADVFFPNLTLRETIRYSALLRLPREYSFKEKLAKVEEIIKTLHLEDCAGTIIGNTLVRGLSGGEKKRTNIGCELLTDPHLLLLDEPTSGLDSSSALNLMETLVNVAREGNRTVVTSIHQPSSQLYHMFDGLLLMAKGKVAYFGKASEAMDYVASVGLHCTIHYNPADYLLELVSEDSSRKVLIGEDPKQEERPVQRKWWQRLFKLSPPPPTLIATGDKDQTVDESVKLEEYASSPQLSRPQTVSTSNPLSTSIKTATSANSTKLPKNPSGSQNFANKDSLSSHSHIEGRSIPQDRKWMTRWYWQFLVLTVRTFRQSRHNILSILNVVQTVLVATITALVWFQVPKVEKSIPDGYSYVFFTIIFWGFNSALQVITTFSGDRVIVNRERTSGTYHLSAYFLAKSVSELPLFLFKPSLFLLLTYFTVGLNNTAFGFFGTWTVYMMTSLVGQSFGLFFSTFFFKFTHSFVYGVLVMLAFMLLGGFFVENLAIWLQWAQYISFMTYSYRAALQFSFPPDVQYSCAEMSEYAVCVNGTNATISGTDILETLGIDTPLYGNILILLLYALVIHYLAYLSLRYLHRPKN